MALRIITPPASLPVTLDQARRHLRIYANGGGSPVVSDHDQEIEDKIAAVVEELENPMGPTARAFITQTWELVLDDFPERELRIPMPPLSSIESIKYLDTVASLQTVPGADYAVDTTSQPGWVSPGLSGWPETYDSINTVVVRFVAGYGASPADVPASARSAILLRVEADFDRGDKRELLIERSDALLRPFEFKFPFL